MSNKKGLLETIALVEQNTVSSIYTKSDVLNLLSNIENESVNQTDDWTNQTSSEVNRMELLSRVKSKLELTFLCALENSADYIKVKKYDLILDHTYNRIELGHITLNNENIVELMSDEFGAILMDITDNNF